jgi:hypothetical protein
VIRVIVAGNPGVEVQNRGAYLRVLVPSRCVLLRAQVERVLERPFVLPGDLEKIMPSFAGTFCVNADEATWSEK